MNDLAWFIAGVVCTLAALWSLGAMRVEINAKVRRDQTDND